MTSDLKQSAQLIAQPDSIQESHDGLKSTHLRSGQLVVTEKGMMSPVAAVDSECNMVQNEEVRSILLQMTFLLLKPFLFIDWCLEDFFTTAVIWKVQSPKTCCRLSSSPIVIML